MEGTTTFVQIESLTHKSQALAELGPTCYGFVRIITQMMKLASIRSTLISPVTLTLICAIINEHEEKTCVMTSPHVKRLSPVLVALGFVIFTPLAGTLSAFAEILFARKILKNSAESFRVEATISNVSPIGSMAF